MVSGGQNTQLKHVWEEVLALFATQQSAFIETSGTRGKDGRLRDTLVTKCTEHHIKESFMLHVSVPGLLLLATNNSGLLLLATSNSANNITT